jgi:hypothetical protein
MEQEGTGESQLLEKVSQALNVGTPATEREAQKMGVMVTKRKEFDLDFDKAMEDPDPRDQKVLADVVQMRCTIYVKGLMKVLDPSSVRSASMTKWINDLNAEVKGRIRRDERRSASALQVGEVLCQKLRDKVDAKTLALSAQILSFSQKCESIFVYEQHRLDLVISGKYAVCL